MKKRLSQKNITCRVCQSRRLIRVFGFGSTPPANEFLKDRSKQSLRGEKWFPLNVVMCRDCSLLQLEDVVDPKLLFKNYVYVSSTSKNFVAHFQSLARDIYRQLGLKKGSLVIDVGSNDGILLKPFTKLGMRVLGIEPAENIARAANKAGIKTIAKFFSPGLASQIKKTYGTADLITATNVFAHVDDLDALLTGVKILLKDNGVFMIEVPYLVNFLKQNLFDTVYHEHLSYFGVRPLKTLFDQRGMKIFDVKKVASHGGSIRVLIKNKGADRKILPSVSRFVRMERQLGLNLLSPYRQFAKRVETNKKRLNQLLAKLKKSGKKIVGYGAPAKGNTLLNYFGIDDKTLDYIVDDSPYKQGLFTPGTHIPVVAARVLYDDMPDYVLILAWNFAKPIMKAHGRYKQKGGRFIIPVPEPRIVY